MNALLEHSAILSTFIRLPFAFKTFVLSIFEWPLKTGFTVLMYFLNSAGTDEMHSFASHLINEPAHKILILTHVQKSLLMPILKYPVELGLTFT